ncbi:MAG TPA: CRISPR-associated protein Cas5 [Abditibacteriaceae bacterium]
MSSVLRARLEVPFWCSFRDPTGVNVHTTFRLPPLTTLYGLVANAMGLSQDDYSLRPRLRFAVGIEEKGDLVETYSKIMKVREAKTPEEKAKPGNFYISTSVIKQKLIRPTFQFYMLSSPSVLEKINTALREPARPLYLGESDDVVDVIDPQIVTASTVESNRFNCAVPGIHAPHDAGQSAAVVNLPYHFVRRGRSDWQLLRRLYTYQLNSAPLLLDGNQAAFDVEGKHIVFEPPIEEADA